MYSTMWSLCLYYLYLYLSIEIINRFPASKKIFGESCLRFRDILYQKAAKPNTRSSGKATTADTNPASSPMELAPTLTESSGEATSGNQNQYFAPVEEDTMDCIWKDCDSSLQLRADCRS